MDSDETLLESVSLEEAMLLLGTSYHTTDGDMNGWLQVHSADSWAGS